MKNNIMIAVLIAAALAGAIGFYTGTRYEKTKLSSTAIVAGAGGGANQGFGGRGGNAGGANGGNRAGLRPVNGDIVSKDATSITVKLQDGSTRIVLYSDKTTMSKGAVATAADLTVGTKVAVFGQESADGSVAAQSIQVNPVLRTMMGTPNGSPSATVPPMMGNGRSNGY